MRMDRKCLDCVEHSSLLQIVDILLLTLCPRVAERKVVTFGLKAPGIEFTTFHSIIYEWSNKLERLSLASLSSLVECNTNLFGQLNVLYKMKCFEYSPQRPVQHIFLWQ